MATSPIKGTFNTSGNAYGVTVSGDYAYVADGSKGLQIINIANSSAPALKGTFNILAEARSVAVSGDYAYVTSYAGFTDLYNYAGFKIVDISNPTTPILAGSWIRGGEMGISVVGNYAYAISNVALQIIDISNPTIPVLKGTLTNSNGGFNYDIAVSGNYAYVASAGYGLQIVDISNPYSPTLKASIRTSGDCFGVSIVGNYAYVARGTDGLQIVDVSNPNAPIVKGTLDTSYAKDVTVIGNYAYLSDFDSSVKVIDISNPTSPTLYKTLAAGTTFGITSSGDNVYVASDSSGLKIIGAMSSSSDSTSSLPPILGDSSNNTIDGIAGVVQLVGGAGDDIYIITDTKNIIVEANNEGIDTIQTSLLKYSLAAGTSIENLTYTGAGNAKLIGNELNNVITGSTGSDGLTGGSGNDILDGKLGADKMVGGIGDDTYYVDNIKDAITEKMDEGYYDIVYTTVSMTLSKNVEKIVAQGIENLNLKGNALNNYLEGNNSNNTLNGGGLGDTLKGGQGNDTFILNSKLKADWSEVDLIIDFETGVDTLHLENGVFKMLKTTGTLSAQNFVSASSGVAVDSNDYIIYNTVNNTFYYDADGSGSVEAIPFLQTITSINIVAADIVII